MALGLSALLKFAGNHLRLALWLQPPAVSLILAWLPFPLFLFADASHPMVPKLISLLLFMPGQHLFWFGQRKAE